MQVLPVSKSADEEAKIELLSKLNPFALIT